MTSNDETSLNWRYNFIRTYLERDIPQLGPRIPAETLGKFWTMLAHSQGTNINASKLASNIEVSSVTVARYIDLLVDLLLIRKIQPYTANKTAMFIYTRTSPFFKYPRGLGQTAPILFGERNDLNNKLLTIIGY